ncbi:MAG: DNA sulfur modification protein DndB [Nostoc sp. DedQUE12b]|nr:DNA sulfur modification protein DndB [Nostoc sp. DedQUE12b]MDZ8088165.1 DNA sulfur modification protein DndB [Nostoc sp. DedQUE12b]
MYDPENNYFNEEKVSQLAQLDWSRENQLWKDNVVRINAQPKNPDKPYKISATVSAVTNAVKTIKITLGWM